MEVSGQLHTPATLPHGGTLVPTGQETGWTPTQLYPTILRQDIKFFFAKIICSHRFTLLSDKYGSY